jgi:hypothetical protein
MLKRGDVFISANDASITIRAGREAYSQVRKVMLVLKNDYGVPVNFVSETVAASIDRMAHSDRSKILVIDEVKVMDKLEMFVALRECPASMKNLPQLTEDIAAHLRSFGLEVIL